MKRYLKTVLLPRLLMSLDFLLGKQIDIDLKKEMGGKKDGQLRKWLTS